MKRILQGIQIFLDNSLIILGLSFLAMKILDWYNPFMDFSGHAQWLQYLLGIFAVLSGTMHLLLRIGKQHELDL